MTGLRRGLFHLIAGVCLLAALALPLVQTKGRVIELIPVIDVSRSIAGQDLSQNIEDLSTLDPDLEVIAFADRSLRLTNAEGLSDLKLYDSSTGVADTEIPEDSLDRASTDLETALFAAIERARFDRVSRILLISDGNQTTGSAKRALPALIQNQIRVFPRLASGAPQPPRIAATRLPLGSPANATVPLEVDILAAEGTEVELAWSVGAGEESSKRITLEAGGTTHRIELTLAKAGRAPLQLRIEGAPIGWRQTLDVHRPTPILLVESGDGLSPLWSALDRRGFEITSTTPANLLRQLEAGDWRALVLSDVTPADFPETTQKAIVDWVTTRGIGLFFAAGPRTFGEGGWSGGPLETILPLSFRLQEERVDLALMIALDKSYSMNGPKMELARVATKSALGELDDEQRFGLVAFDSQSIEAVPLQSAANREAINDLINRIQASSQTNFYPALESCLAQLSATEAEVKHVILITDGKTYLDDYEDLLARIRKQEITVSTVAVGEGADRELLDRIAEWGAGESYFVRDASRVQSILIDEARRKSDRTLVEKSFNAAVLTEASVLDGVDITSAPALRGFVTLEPSPHGKVVLETTTEKPLLASRQSGLGKVWIFAADVKPRWAAEWIDWDGFGTLFSQVLRDAAGERVTRELKFGVTRSGGRFELALELYDADGEPRTDAKASVLVSGAGGDQRVELIQSAPGSFGALYEAVPDPWSDLRFELSVEGETRAFRSLYYPQSDETLPRPPDIDLLQTLATATGGTLGAGISEVLEPGEDFATRQIHLAPWLFAMALLSYLVGLLLHRRGVL